MEHLVLSCLESRSERNGSIYGRFLLGPFKVGQGTTVATALRRTLLSELQGIAITAVEIKGATHQYSSIAGVRESALDIILNLKQVVLTGDIKNGLPAVGYLVVQGPKAARGCDLKLPNGIRCVNEDQYIGSVSADGALAMKFVVSAGKSYVTPHSPSAQTLTPSLFQPKMRKVGITPLALRANGKLSCKLLEIIGKNSPLDTKHGERSLLRGEKPPHLSGSLGNIVISNAARRVTSFSTINEVPSTFPVTAFAIGAEVAGGTAKSLGWPGTKELSTSLRPPETNRSQTTAQHGSNQPSLLPSPLGLISELPHPPPGIASQCTDSRTRVKPEHRRGVLSAGIQQLSTDGPVMTPATDKLKNGDRFGELRTLVQRGKQWDTDSSPLPIDAIFMPVNKVNFSLQIDDQWQEPRERVILEIWTNGSIHPRQAISEAASYLVYLFSLLRQADAWLPSITQPLMRPRRSGWRTADQAGPRSFEPVTGQNQESEVSTKGINFSKTTLKNDSPHVLTKIRRNSSVDIADLDLSVQAYVILKRAGVGTLGDLMSLSIESIGYGGIAPPSVSNEINALIKRLALE